MMRGSLSRVHLVALLIIVILGGFSAAVPSHASISFMLYVWMNGCGSYSLDPVSEYGNYLWGTDVEVTITGDDVSNSSSTRYFYDSVVGDGSDSYTGDAMVFHVTMNSDINEDVEWRAEYKVIFDASGITGDTGLNTVVTIGGVAKTKADLPFSAWYDSGATITFTYASPIPGAYDLSTTTVTMTDVSGHLYSIGVTNTHTVTGPATIMGAYVPHTATTTATTSTGGYGTATATTTHTSGLGSAGFDLSGGFGLMGGFGAWLIGYTYELPNWILLFGLSFFLIVILVYRRKKKKTKRKRRLR